MHLSFPHNVNNDGYCKPPEVAQLIYLLHEDRQSARGAGLHSTLSRILQR